VPARGLRPCTMPGCRSLTSSGRCADHDSDRQRGNARSRGYDAQHEQTFRAAVLRRDRICVVCRQQPATVADHHPRSRRQLAAAGADPNDPRHGRGLCASCHSRATAQAQPGGWNAPR
jgi:5-methylcytosine-specific restriction enzyme A